MPLETIPVADIGTITRTRAAAKGWLTRSIANLHETLQKGEDRFAVDDCLKDLDKRLTYLQDVQTQYELAIEPDKLDEAIQEMSPSFDKASKLRIQAMRYLASLEEKEEKDDDLLSNKSGSHQSARLQTVRLPKLELSHFSGAVTEWTTWWETFKATVDDSELAEVTKFSYLQSLLEGEAASVIKGLTLSSAHYRVACDLLQERFGRRELIIFSHIQKLMHLETEGKNSLVKLKNLQDQVLIHVRSLEALGIDGSTFGIFLTPLVLSRLPSDVRMEWARKGEGHEGDLKFLLDFLKEEIQRRERADSFKVSDVKTSVSSETKGKRTVPTASALVSSSSSCGVCKGYHMTAKCHKLLKMSLPERVETVRSAYLCYRCLSPDHIMRRCKSSVTCPDCGGQYNKLLCYCKEMNVQNTAADRPAVKRNMDVHQVGVAQGGERSARKTKAILQVAKVTVRGPKESHRVHILFDSGSDKSYISQNLVRKLGLKPDGTVYHRYAVFGGGRSAESLRNVYKFGITCVDMSCLTLTGIEVPTICAPLSRPHIPKSIMQKFSDLPLAECDHGEVHVDVLIGLDYYWDIVMDEIVRVPGHNAVAQRSLVGYILSGQVLTEGSKGQSTMTSHQLYCLNDVSDKELRQFWDLDVIGISAKDDKLVEDPVLTEFNERVEFIDGRYCVNLPWKKGMKTQLLSNEKAARIRLGSLCRKLERDLSLQEGYNAALNDMEAASVIEEVAMDSEPVGPVFYLPHRPVVRESSTSTRIRPVFDASAKAENGISLNDCLETGPSLIPNITEILIRFRRWRYALTSDISKAFLQIALKSEEKDVHRFLWDVNGSKRTMRFRRVTFGVKSSPFLLNATIRYHLRNFESSNVVRELVENLYVDDWLSGADYPQEITDMYLEAQNIMSKAGMKLAKWSSNSRVISDLVDVNYENSVKVLGTMWSLDVDCFTFSGLEVPTDLIVTKRLVLSLIARIFDPLGFLVPFTITAKFLFQKLWQLGVDWDEHIPEDLATQFVTWTEGFKLLKSWSIPRRYSDQAWSDLQGIELHAFGDSSMAGYGAVVYIRIPMGGDTYTCSLVIGKAKVAPLKSVTLPRLELLGSLLAARLLMFVRKTLKLPEHTRYQCWTDSMAVLGWIKGDPNRWKQFVANRVREIQNHTEPVNWSYCPTDDNPADLLTRGITADKLVESKLWLTGPGWLSMSYDQWPVVSSCQMVTSDLVKSEVMVTAVVAQPDPVFDVTRWGKLTKAIRVVGWVLRFIHNAKNKREGHKTGDLSHDEQLSAKTCLLKQSQRLAFYEEISLLEHGKVVPKTSALFKLSPFLDGEGMVRVAGRLQMSELSYGEKHPIILPKDHLAKLMVRFEHVLLKHAGVSTLVTSLRNDVWIIGLRQLCKSVVYECMPCQRLLSKPCSQVAAFLPENRVSKAPPFTVTGIDFAGPLYCVDFSQQKFYICLFTCAVVRAIHLELTGALSANEFCLAYRRFVARRGLPKIVYSDNAKTFKGAQTKIQAAFGHESPEWKFIAPRAPWWGGWWERLVRSVKKAIKACVGKNAMTKAELEVLLCEIEFTVNSRPLTFASDEISLDRPITPNHFLSIGGNRPQGEVNEDQGSITGGDLSELYEGSKQRLNTFWRAWSTDYLRNLPCIVPQFQNRGFLKEGSIVLINEDNVPRLGWVLGRVIELFPSKDGKVRSVKLKTSKGEFVRAVQKLHKLEFLDSSTEDLVANQPQPSSNVPVPCDNICDSGIEETGEVAESGEVVPKISKYGRKIKPVDRLTYDH